MAPHRPGDLPDSVHVLFRLDPAEQVLPADRVQQGRMVGGHVPPDHPDHLVIAIASGHEPALASDQLGHRASHLAFTASVLPRCSRDLGVLAPRANPDLRTARHRARRPAPGWPPARPPGPAAVHLPGRQPPPPGPPRRASRGSVARTRPPRGRHPAQPAAVQAAPGLRRRHRGRTPHPPAVPARRLARPPSPPPGPPPPPPPHTPAPHAPH